MNLLDFLGAAPRPPSRPGVKVIHTRVVDNVDKAGLGRVMIQVPWLKSPVAALVAAVTAGPGRGTFFIPQVDDEVLVLLTEEPNLSAYVIGSLWTSHDPPPRREPSAASEVQLIRTSKGHEIELDDDQEVLTITTPNGQRVRLSSDGVEILAGSGDEAARLELGADGTIKLEGGTVTVKARDLKLEGDTVSIESQGQCTIRGAMVAIN
jgi:phage baseplate assembly protein gpV